jgi:hypothetical protein
MMVEPFPLPDELAALYAAIIGEAVPEFRRLAAAVADRLSES